MTFLEHYIYATFIGKPESFFKVGTTYLLKVQERDIGSNKITVILNFAQYYHTVHYKSFVDFLKDWTEIVTTVPTEVIEKSTKVLYVDTSEDDDLPFKREVLDPPKTSIPTINRPLPLLPPPRKRTIKEGEWFCSVCKHINSDINSFYCEECGSTRLEFD